jgi:hypothetical protein
MQKRLLRAGENVVESIRVLMQEANKPEPEPEIALLFKIHLLICGFLVLTLIIALA